MKIYLYLALFVRFVPGETDVNTDQVSVMERDSVTLNSGVKVNQNDKITWYYNNNRIGQVNGQGEVSHICADDQCTEQYRNRLTFDHETGSLTIANTRTTDSGEYRLVIIGSGRSSVKIFNVTVMSADKDSMSVMEGYSVTLNTDAKTIQKGRIRWFFNDVCIAHIINQSIICTDVKCNTGTQIFRNRLELDTQTGSLTITNINTTHSGLYRLQIGSDVKIFNVSVHGVSAAEREEMKNKSVYQGESVALGAGVVKEPYDEMKWYFNNIAIAEVTGDQSQICTDDRCKEIFTDRLKVDHHTGSLTITNTRTTDSGLYKLVITSRTFGIHRRRRSISISSVKSFNVYVIVPDSGLSSGAVVGICVVVGAVLFAVLGWLCHRYNNCPEEYRRSRVRYTCGVQR